MLKIDCNGFNVTDDNRITVTHSPDERIEHEFTKVIAKRIVLQNHNIMLRMDNLSPQERANFLLDGRMDEVSLFLKIEEKTDKNFSLADGVISSWPAGYEIRIPNGEHPYDLLLASLLEKWFDLIPDFHKYPMIRKPMLMPVRASELVRPARVEIAFQFWQASDWDYWASPVMLRTIAQHISRAINEFDDKFHEVKNKGIEDVDIGGKAKSLMAMAVPTETELREDMRTRRKIKISKKSGS